MEGISNSSKLLIEPVLNNSLGLLIKSKLLMYSTISVTASLSDPRTGFSEQPIRTYEKPFDENYRRLIFLLLVSCERLVSAKMS